MDKPKSITGASVAYGRSAQLSRFKVLAQKLAEQIERLNQDPSFKERWVWQLIQNAKDAPNKFQKVNMKIQIHDSELKFMHNGDPFRSQDLQSISNQYSNKIQKNQRESETTGKYGTGFITTYILSKSIQIQGIIKSTPEPDQSEEQQQEHIKGRKIVKLNQQDVKKQQIIKLNQDAEKQAQEQKSVYQKFKIFLNRQYKNRDKDFPRILMQNDEQIKNQLSKLEQLKPWKRNETDLDTVFSYQKMGDCQSQIIYSGIKSLKELFPYALLFNPKLNQIEVQDLRKLNRIQGFKIKRTYPIQRKIVNIFTCQIIDQKSINQQIKIAFHQDQQSASIIAVPIKIIGQQRHLCSLPKDCPKVFKQFPLIGSQNIGYNYVFTSKKLYPNQQRSNLLLGINGQKQKSQKATQNWKVLHIVFQKARNLFKCLKVFINASKQKFLQIASKEYLGRTQEVIANEYKKFIQQVSQYQIFQCLGGRSASVKQIIFICFSNQIRQKQLQKSTQMIDKFAFLFPNMNILSKKAFKTVYSKLCQVGWTKWPFKYVTLIQCIAVIEKKSYDELCKLSKSQQDLKEKMHNIYQFLLLYKPQFLSKKYNKKIFLTQNMKLEYPKSLFLKGSLDQKFIKIFDDLDLKNNLNSMLINWQMQQYFTDKKIESQDQIQPIQLQFIRRQLIDKKFDLDKLKKNLDLFKDYLKYLQTIQVGMNIIITIKAYKIFKSIDKLGAENVKFPNIKKQQVKNYQSYLKTTFLNYIQGVLQSYDMVSVKDFGINVNLTQKSQSAKLIQTIKWFDSVLWLQQSENDVLTWSIAKDCKFVKSKSLCYMQTQLDNQDILFYNLKTEKHSSTKLYNLSNAKLQSSNQIQSEILKKLVHSKITYVNKLKITYYSYQFRDPIKCFNDLNNQRKKQFLNYVEHLMKCKLMKKAGAQQKIKQFSTFLSTRHIQLLKVNNFSDQEIAIIYDLIKNKEDLLTIKKLKQKGDIKNVLTILDNMK